MKVILCHFVLKNNATNCFSNKKKTPGKLFFSLAIEEQIASRVANQRQYDWQKLDSYLNMNLVFHISEDGSELAGQYILARLH